MHYLVFSIQVIILLIITDIVQLCFKRLICFPLRLKLGFHILTLALFTESG